MSNTRLRSSSLITAWGVSVMLIVAGSVAVGAHLSTTAILLVLGIAPAIVVAMLAHGQPSPSVAQILNSVEAKDDRS